MKAEREAGESLFRCGVELEKLAATLPPGAELHLGLVGRELSLTIALKDASNRVWQSSHRFDSGEGADITLVRLVHGWKAACRELRLDEPATPEPAAGSQPV